MNSQFGIAKVVPLRRENTVKDFAFDVLSSASACHTRDAFEELLMRLLPAINGATHVVYGYGTIQQSRFFTSSTRMVGPNDVDLMRPLTPIVPQAVTNSVRLRQSFFCNTAWLSKTLPILGQARQQIRSMQVLTVKDMQSPAVSFFCFINLDGTDPVTLSLVELAAPLLAATQTRIRSNERRNQRPVGPSITPREGEVLRWVAIGKTDREIAELLDKSIHTVKNQVRKILDKFGVSKRAQLAVLAEQSSMLNTIWPGHDSDK